MGKTGTVISAVVFTILLVVFTILSFIMSAGLDAGLYRELQIEYEIASYAGVDQVLLDRATVALIDYMNGDRDDIVVKTDEGDGHELFNVREKTHMEDVKQLFELGRTIKPVIAVLLVLMLIFMLISSKQSMKRHFLRTCAISLACILGAWIIMAILAAIDFTAFWTAFHRIFFNNDLWLLNPSTDFLIRMMPQRFFVGMVTHIMKGFFLTYGAMLVFSALGHVLVNIQKRKDGK